METERKNFVYIVVEGVTVAKHRVLSMKAFTEEIPVATMFSSVRKFRPGDSHMTLTCEPDVEHLSTS